MGRSAGRPGRHRQTDRPTRRHINLIAAAGLAAIAAVAISVAITGPGSPSAQTRSRTAAADPPRPLDRTSRDDVRTPVATPTPEPTETPAAQPVQKKHQRHRIVSRGACEASYYGSGGRTSSGEAFDPDALTAAHRTLPIGSKVRVINKNNDRAVVVRINDRGPFVAGRCLDLSSAAMHAVGGTGSGVIPVRYEVLAKV
ncbi:septal ring lytic transglycosylase RlpA family protein [Actinomadura sp. DC4]|uniref:septal ring lytic transglycosylase RlpA family protein n=1 Tax=Actinomadura sp. DC4 TaxID=3055069 RepID=UPI0025B1DBC5|nr:septal ring lytic transglycosylase RlpA family protein [Actinomadura sp. DC4]MDN3354601.1 septal ring lytic transglycosylase RlpA family protein [Actinomadura sp. DC4]